ncbi:sugar ABC transporter substrate-binding protein [Neolewinella sp.]|uniref:sugar ABC transporter substrate-binding protein n=1 Tax=Neolewinella sp. TaxID=2993543 RepID=UPI003B52CAD5
MKPLSTLPFLSVLLWAGCATTADDSPIIGISFETLQTEYWVSSLDALRAACDDRGFGYVEAVANGDANRQFEQVNNFIARGVDGIVIAPKDGNTVIPIIKAANRAGVPIVIYNRLPASNSGKYVTVVADNFEITRQTVRHLCELARATGTPRRAMILIGDLGDVNAVRRREGFNAAIADYPELIELVAEVPTEWNQEKALAGVTNALQAHPDINFIFSSSDFLFPSVVSALRNKDRYHPVGHPRHILLAGFDGDATAYQMLVDGYLDADGVQDVFYECEQAVDAIARRLAGESVPELLIDPGLVIHQENLSEKAGRMWGAVVAGAEQQAQGKTGE